MDGTPAAVDPVVKRTVLSSWDNWAAVLTVRVVITRTDPNAV